MIKTEKEKKSYKDDLTVQKGTIVDFSDTKGILVSLGDNTPLIPCTFLNTSKKDIPNFQKGDRIILSLPEYPGDKGCVMGVIENYTPKITNKNEKYLISRKQPLSNEKIKTIDEQVIHINAEKGIKIQCGKGSITITEEGDIKIEGTSLVNRSKGSNKIKGSSVKIN